MKKLSIILLILVIQLLFSAGAVAETIPKGTEAMLFMSDGWAKPVVSNRDVTVTIVKEQWTEDQLKDFSKTYGGDWSDGVIVQEGHTRLLVHKRDLKP